MPDALNKIVFVDTETTELDEDLREVYEIGYILRTPDAADVEVSMMLLDCRFGRANHTSLKIGRAHQRHPKFNRDLTVAEGDIGEDGITEYVSSATAAERVEAAVRDAVIIGLVPNFDEFSLKRLLMRHDWPWGGHYHMHDSETAAVGYLNGLRRAGVPNIPVLGWPPYDTEEISRQVDVKPPDEKMRHTALGDARWARDLWDAVTASNG